LSLSVPNGIISFAAPEGLLCSFALLDFGKELIPLGSGIGKAFKLGCR
jgi:hypothetical protein